MSSASGEYPKDSDPMLARDRDAPEHYGAGLANEPYPQYDDQGRRIITKNVTITATQVSCLEEPTMSLVSVHCLCVKLAFKKSIMLAIGVVYFALVLFEKK